MNSELRIVRSQVNPDQVHAILHEQPFRPFKLVLDDGREFRVPHPEFLVLVPPRRRTAVHFDADSKESQHTFIDLLHVTTMQPLNHKPRRAPKRRRRPK